MEVWRDIAILVGGLLLRFGVPLAITAVIVFLLRKLDAKWQGEADRLKRELDVTEHLAITVPCWNVFQCRDEIRGSCPAYLKRFTPCWQVFREEQGRLRDKCLNCKIFRQALKPLIIQRTEREV